MATVRCVLNMIAFVVVLASRSFVAAKRAECQDVVNDYVNNWTVRNAKAKTLLKQDRNLSYEDVKELFMPTCDMQGNYATRQCFMNAYCWCSDSKGKLLSGTFQKGKAEELDCSKFYHSSICMNIRNGEFHVPSVHHSKMQGGKHLVQEWRQFQDFREM